jgi:hypothetical protein
MLEIIFVLSFFHLRSTFTTSQRPCPSTIVWSKDIRASTTSQSSYCCLPISWVSVHKQLHFQPWLRKQKLLTRLHAGCNYPLEHVQCSCTFLLRSLYIETLTISQLSMPSSSRHLSDRLQGRCSEIQHQDAHPYSSIATILEERQIRYPKTIQAPNYLSSSQHNVHKVWRITYNWVLRANAQEYCVNSSMCLCSRSSFFRYVMFTSTEGVDISNMLLILASGEYIKLI